MPLSRGSIGLVDPRIAWYSLSRSLKLHPRLGGSGARRSSGNMKLTVKEQAAIKRALAILEKNMRVHGVTLTSPTAVRDYLRLRLAAERQEVFVVLFLDAQHRLISAEAMFRGTLTQTSVYPREVVRAAL